MRIIYFILLFCSFAFSQFNSISYDAKGEDVLKTFDIEPSFLNNEYFISVKNNFLSNKKEEYLLEKFKDGYEFIPTLKEMFLKEEIPQEFLYLAMIESGFSLSARSNKRAVGMWQFIPKTAKSMGLTINTQIDERKDPIKSTQVAIEYLKYLKNSFGKWYLAAIAYNCGEGRLRRAIAKANSDSLGILLDPDKKYIPLESRMYIRKILSVSFLFHNIDTLKTNDYDYFLNRGANSLLASIEVLPATPLVDIANEAGIDLDELKRLNPHFKKNITPTTQKLYNVYLPYKYLAIYKEKNLDNNLKEKLNERKYLVHRIKKGDTINAIARKYGVSKRLITQYNSIKNVNKLSINQEIIIPLEKENA